MEEETIVLITVYPFQGTLESSGRKREGQGHSYSVNQLGREGPVGDTDGEMTTHTHTQSVATALNASPLFCI